MAVYVFFALTVAEAVIASQRSWQETITAAFAALEWATYRLAELWLKADRTGLAI